MMETDWFLATSRTLEWFAAGIVLALVALTFALVWIGGALWRIAQALKAPRYRLSKKGIEAYESLKRGEGISGRW